MLLSANALKHSTLSYIIHHIYFGFATTYILIPLCLSLIGDPDIAAVFWISLSVSWIARYTSVQTHCDSRISADLLFNFDATHFTVLQSASLYNLLWVTFDHLRSSTESFRFAVSLFFWDLNDFLQIMYGDNGGWTQSTLAMYSVYCWQSLQISHITTPIYTQ